MTTLRRRQERAPEKRQEESCHCPVSRRQVAHSRLRTPRAPRARRRSVDVEDDDARRSVSPQRRDRRHAADREGARGPAPGASRVGIDDGTSRDELIEKRPLISLIARLFLLLLLIPRHPTRTRSSPRRARSTRARRATPTRTRTAPTPTRTGRTGGAWTGRTSTSRSTTTTTTTTATTTTEATTATDPPIRTPPSAPRTSASPRDSRAGSCGTAAATSAARATPSVDDRVVRSGRRRQTRTVTSRSAARGQSTRPCTSARPRRCCRARARCRATTTSSRRTSSRGGGRSKVRSMSHWSPYDRVGVVNADP